MAVKKKVKAKSTKAKTKKPIEQYEHKGKKRKNNPPVGLVTPTTDKESEKKKYAYDPHMDPSLQWAGKAEHTSFEVPTVSLHVHERIDPKTIMEAVKKKNGTVHEQMGLFESPEENPPLRDALDFYKHSHGWSNRMIAGDSLLVMNSLLEKEGMAGQVQMVYIDPPYGIKYGSNFQPFVNKRDVKDGKDDDLNQEPEMIRAFRDTWELGIHSYLTYLRDRLLLAREMLHESGSCFVQIGNENIHTVRCLLDEVFGPDNCVSLISYITTSGFETKNLSNTANYLLWYGRDISQLKFRRLFYEKDISLGGGRYKWVKFSNGTFRGLTIKELNGEKKIPDDGKLYQPTSLISQGSSNVSQDFECDGKIYNPGSNQHWKTTLEGLNVLKKRGRIHVAKNSIRYVRYADDFPYQSHNNVWSDTATGNFTEDKIYVVQTAVKLIERCILMTTDPGDLVFDPTCGSGTTAYVAEQWGRRWITCDTSRVAIALAKQRMMTGLHDYYKLAHPEEGVGSGFIYKIVPHITLKSIANNEPPPQETLYDQPAIDRTRARVTGPFTVEAVPAPMVKPLDGVGESVAGDESVARSGETHRHNEWRSELLKTGVRGKNGQMILFSRIEPLSGTRWLHADGETRPNDEGKNTVKEDAMIYGKPERVVIVFGPEHAPLEQKQVEMAWQETQTLIPKPTVILFASFQFDPEAAKDIDELTLDKTGMTFLKVQMNTDLLTDDLKKKRSNNQSFWLIGQPDVELRSIQKGDDKGKLEVEVHGFDYYNTKSGAIESGNTAKIALWMLDTDYDGRSLYPRQVFFPMSGEKDGWSRLAKNLKAEIDEELIESYRGTVSLPFEPGENKQVAVKIVDDRGIESLKIISL